MSVFRRGKLWAATIYDPSTQQKRWLGTFETQREAKSAEAKARLQAKTLGPGETCDHFAARWTRDYPRRKRSTNEHNAERVTKFAEDFKGRKLASVTRLDARRWTLENPRRHAVVRAMFSDALRDGLVSENPFVGMRLPQPKGRKDLTVPMVEEVSMLAERASALCGPYFSTFVTTAAYTGMRPGELYGLDWPEVDLLNEEIDVVAQITRWGERTLPKNNLTRRIALPSPALIALRELRETAYGDGSAVFRNLRGSRLTGRTIHYYWDRVRCAIGRPDMTLYELRHFAAAYMLNVLHLPPHAIAHQLGHTDGGVLVQKLYGHPDERVAREQIKAAFSRSVTPLREVSGADSVADGSHQHESPATAEGLS